MDGHERAAVLGLADVRPFGPEVMMGLSDDGGLGLVAAGARRRITAMRAALKES